MEGFYYVHMTFDKNRWFDYFISKYKNSPNGKYIIRFRNDCGCFN